MMPNIHYINFGTAKTGTTWLYRQLLKNQDIASSMRDKDKEPPMELVSDQKAYVDYFNNTPFSVNFQPNLWMLDSYQLNWLETVQTHCSIIFRNPFDIIDSYYNFWVSRSRMNPNAIKTGDDFVESFGEYFQYSKILKRLPKNVHVMIYDNIKNNPVEAIDSLFKYLEIPRLPITLETINATNKTKSLTFSDNAVKVLNCHIVEFQECISTNVLGWMKNV